MQPWKPSAGCGCWTSHCCGHRTWARIEGELDDVARPLIALHGGPGLPSDYLEPLAALAQWPPFVQRCRRQV